MTSVIIVNECGGFFEELIRTFEATSDFSVAGVAHHRLAALELIGADIPDLLIIDFNIPGSGILTTRQVSTTYPSVKILMLSNLADDELVGNALCAGACSYLPKSVSMDELLVASRQILCGDYQLPASLAKRLLSTTQHAERSDAIMVERSLRFTRREEAILFGISLGRSKAQISNDLGMREPIIKTHISNIMLKLHHRNRIDDAIACSLGIPSRLHNEQWLLKTDRLGCKLP